MPALGAGIPASVAIFRGVVAGSAAGRLTAASLSGGTCRSVGEFSSSPLAQDHSDPVDVAGEGGEADR